jgi:type IV pilus assembly protein PilE
MLDLANRQQQYFLDQRTYAGATTCTTAGLTTLNVTLPSEVSAYYDVCIMQGAGPPPTFTIKSAPKAGTMMAGDGDLTIDQSGTKLLGGAVSDKWQGR